MISVKNPVNYPQQPSEVEPNVLHPLQFFKGSGKTIKRREWKQGDKTNNDEYSKNILCNHINCDNISNEKHQQESNQGEDPFVAWSEIFGKELYYSNLALKSPPIVINLN